MNVPSSARVLWSAFRAGSLVSVCLRPSRRSVSGAVLDCSFSSFPAAMRFASLWGRRLPGAAPRLSARSSVCWSVSVPVASVVSVDLNFSLGGGVRRAAAISRWIY